MAQETAFVGVTAPQTVAWDIELAFGDDTVLHLRKARCREAVASGRRVACP